jgi:hypothetical protein
MSDDGIAVRVQIEGLDNHLELHTLDVAELTHLPALQSLDVSKNRIDDPAAVELLWALPGLTLLRLEGNPVVHKIPHYRKTTIAKMPNLHYLDDSPVFKKDRRLAEAFARGGLEVSAQPHFAFHPTGTACSSTARYLTLHGRSKSSSHPPWRKQSVVLCGPVCPVLPQQHHTVSTAGLAAYDTIWSVEGPLVEVHATHTACRILTTARR